MASLGSISVNITATTAGLTSALDVARRKTVTSMKNIEGAVHRTTDTYKMMEGQWVKTGSSLAVSTKQSFGNMLKTMLNFQGFMAKIIHYITFSIGVQMVMGIRRGIESAIDIFKEFDKAIYETASVAGYLGASFDDAVADLKEFAREVVKGTIFTAGEAAEALYDLASAGYDIVDMARKGEKGMEAFGAILDYATATGSNLKDATYAVTTAMKQFNLTLDDTNMIVDTFTTLITSSFMTQEKMADAMRYTGPIASALGRSLEETASAAAVLTNRGFEGSQSGQRLNMIFTKLLKPTDRATEMLTRIGVSLNDINPEFHSLIEILYTLQAAQFGSAEASEMFRARTAASAMVLVNAADEVSNYMRKIKSGMGITASIAKKQVESFAGSMAILQQTLHDTAIEFGETIRPLIDSLVDGFKNKLLPALTTIGGILTTLAPIIGSLITLFISWKISLKATAIFAKFAAVEYASLTAAVHALGISITVALARAMAFSGIFLGIFNILSRGINIVDVLSVALSGLGISIAAVSAIIHASLGPIGWAMAAIGGIIALIRTFTGESEEEEIQLKKIRELLKVISDDYKDTESAVRLYESSIEDLLVDLKEEVRVRKELNQLRAEGKTDTQGYTKVALELQKIEGDISKDEEEFIRLTAQYLNYYKKSVPIVDEAVTSFIKYYDAEKEISYISERRGALLEDETEALNELNDAQAIYTTNSEEYSTAWSEYNSIVEERKALLERMEDLIGDSTDAEGEYNRILGEQPEAIRAIIGEATQLYKLRADMIDLLQKRTKLESEQTAFLKVQENWQGYLAESTKYLREEEEKLFEIQFKRYMLEKDRTDQLDELFEALAAEGLLTDEIIQGYIDMKEAEGGLIQSGVEFADVLDTLSESGQDVVTDWVQAYIKALKDGMTPTEAIAIANEAIVGTLSDLVGYGSSAYNTIMNYATAQYDAWKSTQSFEDVIVPFTEDLYENELASEEVAGAYGDIKESSYDAASAMDEWKEALQKVVTEGLQPVIDAAAAMWIALGGFPEAEFPEFNLREMIEQIQPSGLQPYPFDLALRIFPPGIQRPVEEFEDAIWELNKETGWFADKSADAKTALQGYLNYVAGFGISTTDAYSSKIATAASVMKTLTERGYDEEYVLGLVGGKFTDLASLSNTALSGISSDLNTVGQDIEDINTALFGPDGLFAKLIAATHPEYVINIVQKVETIYEEVGEPDISEPEAGIIEKYFGENLRDLYPNFPWDWGEWKKGIIASQKGFITKGPQLGLIGEAGPEAVIPLAGANKKYGQDILDYIIPRFFPERAMQGGALIGGPYYPYPPTMPDKPIPLPVDPTPVKSVLDSLKSTLIQLKDFIGTFLETINSIKDVITQLVEAISSIGETFKVDVTVSSEGLKESIQSTILGFRVTTEEFGNRMLGYVGNFGQTLTSYGRDFTNNIYQSTRHMLNVSNLMEDAARSLANAIARLKSQKGGIATSPTLGIFGEAGAEALIPLEGRNKKFGREILSTIIPKYYPELMRQTGGVYGGGGGNSYGGDTFSESYSITGPITVVAQNPQDFTEQLKRRYRTSKRR